MYSSTPCFPSACQLGHTAIRCENLTRKTDIVYNYGVFDFSSGGFVLRFALGETDYRLDKDATEYFTYAYYYNGRDVHQQVLNLNQAEKERLVALLEENYRPDRELIYRYSEGHPWSRLAMDLCLGSQADQPISRRTMQFVPFLLQKDLTHTQIADSIGHKRPLVSGEGLLIKAMEKEKSRGEWLTPDLCAWLCFAVTLLLTVYGLRRKKTLWGVDVFWLSAAGLAGCVLAFLVFFSQHPCMSPNYLLLVFHPLHLLCLPEVIYKERKGSFSFYQATNFIVLTLFMLFWGVFPQEFPSTVVPLALCLWTRSIAHIIWIKKRIK